MPTQTVLFLHGLGATGAMWSSHVAALPEFACLAPDLPAHGTAAAQPWVSLAATAADVARLIEGLPERRTHVVGLSLGGAVALELLCTRPELLDRVVIDGTASRPWRFAPLLVGSVTLIAPFIHRRLVVRRIASIMGLPRESWDAFAEDFRRVTPRSFRQIIHDVFELRFASDGSIRNEILLLAGELDIEGVRASNVALARELPNASAWMVPWRLHAWVAADPALHVAAVRAFLVGQPLPDGLVEEHGLPLVRRLTMRARFRRRPGVEEQRQE